MHTHTHLKTAGLVVVGAAVVGAVAIWGLDWARMRGLLKQGVPYAAGTPSGFNPLRPVA